MSFLFREMTEAAVYRFLKNRCSQEFRKIHIKTPVPKSRFDKVAGTKPAIEKKLRTRVSKMAKDALENCFSH